MLESFNLDPKSDVPLFRQLYVELRSAILNGRITPGTQMPSTRDFAEDLGISRNTVLNAFDQLIAEGYLQGKTGSGTFVSPVLVLPESEKKPKKGKRLSQRGHLLERTKVTAPRKLSTIVPFRVGVPALEAFPMRTWLRLQNSARKKSPIHFSYQDPAGYHRLRAAIAQYLRGARGVRCEASQVIIVAGSQQGLDLTARVCADVGDRVWVENPGYLGARGAFTAAGLEITAVPIDEQGMNPEKAIGKPRLISVTPSYQFPLGITMSLTRRMTLLELAHRYDAFVIEDDYDSEFRYAGRPLAALQGLDNNGRVIYIGTFSKVLFPGLRLGYLVVPEDLTHAFVSARALLDRQPPILDQIALAEFIEAGYFNRHIRKMRKLYGARQKELIEAARELRNYVSISPSNAGMHVVGWLKKSSSDQRISSLAAENGVEVPAVSDYCIEAIGRMGLLFGYAAFDAQQMKNAIRSLLNVFKSI